MTKKTLLLVFIHGFKGTDHTFHHFPQDLQALLSHALPQIDVLSVQYPQFETRGDLRACVARFKEWLQNKVIDLEVANHTPSPTVNPSVRVILCGHSMGGIVAAEALLSIARDAVVPASYADDTTNSTAGHHASSSRNRTAHRAPEDREERPSSAPPLDPKSIFFPYIQAIVAFDTPYLGISPGVLAHGAEHNFNEASAAYKAFDSASKFFGWDSANSSSAQPIANASSRGLPAAEGASRRGRSWGKYAMYGGAIAAVAGAAGAAYLNRNQISEGLSWAGSHLEFVGCLARGAELQKRVERVVELSKTHGIGFANFYGCLGERVSRKTQYAGSVVGDERTFCVIPKSHRRPNDGTGTKRQAPSAERTPPKRRRPSEEEADLREEMQEGEKVYQFAEDASKSKGDWVKCVNPLSSDEVKTHTSMFVPRRNPDYHAMVPRARDWIVGWIDKEWYESSTVDDQEQRPPAHEAQDEAHNEAHDETHDQMHDWSHDDVHTEAV